MTSPQDRQQSQSTQSNSKQTQISNPMTSSQVTQKTQASSTSKKASLEQYSIQNLIRQETLKQQSPISQPNNLSATPNQQNTIFNQPPNYQNTNYNINRQNNKQPGCSQMNRITPTTANLSQSNVSNQIISQTVTFGKDLSEETFGINKPLEDIIIQLPQLSLQSQYSQNQQSLQNNRGQGSKKNSFNAQTGSGQNAHVLFQQQQHQMIQNLPLGSAGGGGGQGQPYYPFQMMNYLIGNGSNVQSESVSPINNSMQIHHQMSHPNQLPFSQSYLSSNSGSFIDLKSPNTHTVQQSVSELNSPQNNPFSPLNNPQLESQFYQQQILQPNQQQMIQTQHLMQNQYIQQNQQQMLSNQQQNPNVQQQQNQQGLNIPIKKAPMKLPRYKPPIVIDTTIGSNFSQKKSTPNSDIFQGQTTGGQGSSGSGSAGGASSNGNGSAQGSQKNSSLSSYLTMVMMIGDGEQNNINPSNNINNNNSNNTGNNSNSSSATSNQSSTKNNSTKSQQGQGSTNSSGQSGLSQNLPTTKVKPKYFNFPQSPNRTILVSDYLKQKLGEERFFKMKSILETSSNPLKILEEHHQVVADVIGEENMELAKIFRYIINTQITPSAATNHLRHKSFQGFEHPDAPPQKSQHITHHQYQQMQIIAQNTNPNANNVNTVNNPNIQSQTSSQPQNNKSTFSPINMPAGVVSSTTNHQCQNQLNSPIEFCSLTNEQDVGFMNTLFNSGVSNNSSTSSLTNTPNSNMKKSSYSSTNPYLLANNNTGYNPNTGSNNNQNPCSQLFGNSDTQNTQAGIDTFCYPYPVQSQQYFQQQQAQNSINFTNNQFQLFENNNNSNFNINNIQFHNSLKNSQANSQQNYSLNDYSPSYMMPLQQNSSSYFHQMQAPTIQQQQQFVQLSKSSSPNQQQLQSGLISMQPVQQSSPSQSQNQSIQIIEQQSKSNTMSKSQITSSAQSTKPLQNIAEMGEELIQEQDAEEQ